MNKEDFLFNLRCITREITCMNPSVFDERFKGGVIKFDHFGFSEHVKIHTEISMSKKLVQFEVKE